jgi:hypothetical protein
VSARHGAASAEEQARIEELRAQADKAGEEVARTLTELAERLGDAGNPRNLARNLAAEARQSALRMVRGIPRKAAREVSRKLTSQRGATRAALAAVPLLAVLGAAVAVARRRRHVAIAAATSRRKYWA